MNAHIRSISSRLLCTKDMGRRERDASKNSSEYEFVKGYKTRQTVERYDLRHKDLEKKSVASFHRQKSRSGYVGANRKRMCMQSGVQGTSAARSSRLSKRVLSVENALEYTGPSSRSKELTSTASSMSQPAHRAYVTRALDAMSVQVSEDLAERNSAYSGGGRHSNRCTIRNTNELMDTCMLPLSNASAVTRKTSELNRAPGMKKSSDPEVGASEGIFPLSSEDEVSSSLSHAKEGSSVDVVRIRGFPTVGLPTYSQRRTSESNGVRNSCRVPLARGRSQTPAPNVTTWPTVSSAGVSSSGVTCFRPRRNAKESSQECLSPKQALSRWNVKSGSCVMGKRPASTVGRDVSSFEAIAIPGLSSAGRTYRIIHREPECGSKRPDQRVPSASETALAFRPTDGEASHRIGTGQMELYEISNGCDSPCSDEVSPPTTGKSVSLSRTTQSSMLSSQTSDGDPSASRTIGRDLRLRNDSSAISSSHRMKYDYVSSSQNPCTGVLSGSAARGMLFMLTGNEGVTSRSVSDSASSEMIDKRVPSRALTMVASRIDAKRGEKSTRTHISSSPGMTHAGLSLGAIGGIAPTSTYHNRTALRGGHNNDTLSIAKENTVDTTSLDNAMGNPRSYKTLKMIMSPISSLNSTTFEATQPTKPAECHTKLATEQNMSVLATGSPNEVALPNRELIAEASQTGIPVSPTRTQVKAGSSSRRLVNCVWKALAQTKVKVKRVSLASTLPKDTSHFRAPMKIASSVNERSVCRIHVKDKSLSKASVKCTSRAKTPVRETGRCKSPDRMPVTHVSLMRDLQSEKSQARTLVRIMSPARAPVKEKLQARPSEKSEPQARAPVRNVSPAITPAREMVKIVSPWRVPRKDFLMAKKAFKNKPLLKVLVKKLSPSKVRQRHISLSKISEENVLPSRYQIQNVSSAKVPSKDDSVTSDLPKSGHVTRSSVRDVSANKELVKDVPPVGGPLTHYSLARLQMKEVTSQEMQVKSSSPVRAPVKEVSQATLSEKNLSLARIPLRSTSPVSLSLNCEVHARTSVKVSSSNPKVHCVSLNRISEMVSTPMLPEKCPPHVRTSVEYLPSAKKSVNKMLQFKEKGNDISLSRTSEKNVTSRVTGRDITSDKAQLKEISPFMSPLRDIQIYRAQFKDLSTVKTLRHGNNVSATQTKLNEVSQASTLMQDFSQNKAPSTDVSRSHIARKNDGSAVTSPFRPPQLDMSLTEALVKDISPSIAHLEDMSPEKDVSLPWLPKKRVSKARPMLNELSQDKAPEKVSLARALMRDASLARVSEKSEARSVTPVKGSSLAGAHGKNPGVTMKSVIRGKVRRKDSSLAKAPVKNVSLTRASGNFNVPSRASVECVVPSSATGKDISLSGSSREVVSSRELMNSVSSDNALEVNRVSPATAQGTVLLPCKAPDSSVTQAVAKDNCVPLKSSLKNASPSETFGAATLELQDNIKRECGRPTMDDEPTNNRVYMPMVVLHDDALALLLDGIKLENKTQSYHNGITDQRSIILEETEQNLKVKRSESPPSEEDISLIKDANGAVNTNPLVDQVMVKAPFQALQGSSETILKGPKSQTREREKIGGPSEDITLIINPNQETSTNYNGYEHYISENMACSKMLSNSDNGKHISVDEIRNKNCINPTLINKPKGKKRKNRNKEKDFENHEVASSQSLSDYAKRKMANLEKVIESVVQNDYVKRKITYLENVIESDGQNDYAKMKMTKESIVRKNAEHRPKRRPLFESQDECVGQLCDTSLYREDSINNTNHLIRDSVDIAGKTVSGGDVDLRQTLPMTAREDLTVCTISSIGKELSGPTLMTAVDKYDKGHLLLDQTAQSKKWCADRLVFTESGQKENEKDNQKTVLDHLPLLSKRLMANIGNEGCKESNTKLESEIKDRNYTTDSNVLVSVGERTKTYKRRQPPKHTGVVPASLLDDDRQENTLSTSSSSSLDSEIGKQSDRGIMPLKDVQSGIFMESTHIMPLLSPQNVCLHGFKRKTSYVGNVDMLIKKLNLEWDIKDSTLPKEIPKENTCSTEKLDGKQQIEHDSTGQSTNGDAVSETTSLTYPPLLSQELDCLSRNKNLTLKPRASNEHEFVISSSLVSDCLTGTHSTKSNPDSQSSLSDNSSLDTCNSSVSQISSRIISSFEGLMKCTSLVSPRTFSLPIQRHHNDLTDFDLKPSFKNYCRSNDNLYLNHGKVNTKKRQYSEEGLCINGLEVDHEVKKRKIKKQKSDCRKAISEKKFVERINRNALEMKQNCEFLRELSRVNHCKDINITDKEKRPQTKTTNSEKEKFPDIVIVNNVKINRNKYKNFKAKKWTNRI